MNDRCRRAPSRGATLVLAILATAGCVCTPPGAGAIRILPAQSTWTPPPAPAPLTEAIAVLPGGARLWYQDSGGSGETVVLLHPASGNATSWVYQQPALVAAGYRVISYSRRGYYRSEPATPEHPGTAAGDLDELADHLKLGRFHLIATAAGGFVALDYALTHEDRLLSLVYSNSLGGVRDAQFRQMLRDLLPPAFSGLPVEFRELGPSYRTSYHAGVERWLAIHALTGSMGQPQGSLNDVTWEAIGRLRLPILLLTSDADLYMPASSLRMFRRHLPRSEAALFSEAGHAPYWEQYEAFNAEILRFLKSHPAR